MPVSRNKNRAMYPLVILSIFQEAMQLRTHTNVLSRMSGKERPSMPTRYSMLNALIHGADCTICTTALSPEAVLYAYTPRAAASSDDSPVLIPALQSNVASKSNDKTNVT